MKNNILDTIDVQDLLYINIDPYDGCGGITIPKIAETIAELELIIEKIKNKEWELDGVVSKEVLYKNVKWLNDNHKNTIGYASRFENNWIYKEE